MGLAEQGDGDTCASVRALPGRFLASRSRRAAFIRSAGESDQAEVISSKGTRCGHSYVQQQARQRPCPRARNGSAVPVLLPPAFGPKVNGMAATQLQYQRTARRRVSVIPRRSGPIPGATLVDQDLLANVHFSNHVLERFAERTGLPLAGRAALEPIVKDLLLQEGLRVPSAPGWARVRKAPFYMQAGSWLLFTGRPNPRAGAGHLTITTVVARCQEPLKNVGRSPSKNVGLGCRAIIEFPQSCARKLPIWLSVQHRRFWVVDRSRRARRGSEIASDRVCWRRIGCGRADRALRGVPADLVGDGSGP